MARCGDCIHFHQCSHYVTPEETFPEVGGCSAFKSKDAFVEVVRCKDCKYYKEQYMQYTRCDHPSQGSEDCFDCWLETQPDDFCSYGERKDNA